SLMCLSRAWLLSRSFVRLLFHSFFFTAPSPPEIYTLSLHDALPISHSSSSIRISASAVTMTAGRHFGFCPCGRLLQSLLRRLHRSEEHTSELQSPCNLVCRLLLEKKKKRRIRHARYSKNNRLRRPRKQGRISSQNKRRTTVALHHSTIR